MARSGLIPRSANCLSTSGTNVSLSPFSRGSYFIPIAHFGGSDIFPPAKLANWLITAAGVGLQTHRHTDAQMYRHTDAQMHRCTDAQRHRDTETHKGASGSM